MSISLSFMRVRLAKMSWILLTSTPRPRHGLSSDGSATRGERRRWRDTRGGGTVHAAQLLSHLGELELVEPCCLLEKKG